MKKLLFAIFVISLTFGCSDIEQSLSVSDQKFSNEELEMNEPTFTGNWGEESAPDANTKTQLNQLKNLKIIKTGSIKIEVENFQTVREQLDSLISIHHGFIVKEDAGRPQNQMQTIVTVKLLPQQFYPFLKSIEPLATKIHAKNIHTSDATQEYTDLEARLKAKEDVASRYKAILTKANTIE